MSLFSAFRYDGKRALVVGGATGMGAAVAELVQDAGAEVVVMDFAEVTLPGAKAIHVNLGDAGVDRRRASTSAAGRSTRCSRARASPTARPNIEKINFIGHRYLIDLLARPRHARARLARSASSRRPPGSGGRRTSRC